MNVLVACEMSGIVREAFAKRGHNAWSCDIVNTERPGNHIVDDVRNIIDYGWDLMIAHPPCTYLSRAGARWWGKSKERDALQVAAFEFVVRLWEAPIEQIAIENPIGKLSAWLRKPDQIVHPYYFGHDEMKATCLWLKNLPPLMYTYIAAEPIVDWTSDRVRKPVDRSRTFQGIAEAMASQWG